MVAYQLVYVCIIKYDYVVWLQPCTMDWTLQNKSEGVAVMILLTYENGKKWRSMADKNEQKTHVSSLGISLHLGTHLNCIKMVSSSYDWLHKTPSHNTYFESQDQQYGQAVTQWADLPYLLHCATPTPSETFCQQNRTSKLLFPSHKHKLFNWNNCARRKPPLRL